MMAPMHTITDLHAASVAERQIQLAIEDLERATGYVVAGITLHRLAPAGAQSRPMAGVSLDLRIPADSTLDGPTVIGWP